MINSKELKTKEPDAKKKRHNDVLKTLFIILIIFVISRLINAGAVLFINEGPLSLSSYAADSNPNFRWAENRSSITTTENIEFFSFKAVSSEKQNLNIYFNDVFINTVSLDETKQEHHIHIPDSLQLENNIINFESENPGSSTPTDSRKMSWQLFSFIINDNYSSDLIHPFPNQYESEQYTFSGMYDLETSRRTISDKWYTFKDAISQWDFDWYSRITTYGYQSSNNVEQQFSSVAFLFLYPLLGYLLTLLGFSSFSALLIINLIFVYFSFVFLYYLTKAVSNDEILSYISVLLFAFYPYNIFLTSGFNEGIFMFFTFLSIYFLNKKQYVPFSIAAGALSATRQNGLAAPIVFIIDYYIIQKNKLSRKSCLYTVGIVIISIWGFLADTLYKYLSFGEWFLTFKAQYPWRQHLHPLKAFKQYFIDVFRHYDVLSPEFIGLVFFYLFVIYVLYYVIKSKFKLDRIEWIILLFSCGYMGISFLTYVFNQSSSISCLGRYMFTCAPLLSIICKNKKLKSPVILSLIVSIFTFYMIIFAMRFSYHLSPI